MAVCHWCKREVPDKDIRLICDICWTWCCIDCLKALIDNRGNEFENKSSTEDVDESGLKYFFYLVILAIFLLFIMFWCG